MVSANFFNRSMMNDHDDGMVAHTEVCRHKQIGKVAHKLSLIHMVCSYLNLLLSIYSCCPARGCWLILLLVLVLTSTAVSSSRYLGGKEKRVSSFYFAQHFIFYAQFAGVTVLATGHGYICSSKKSLTAYKNCEINVSLESHLLVIFGMTCWGLRDSSELSGEAR